MLIIFANVFFLQLLTAGVLGVYFCATNFTPYSSTIKAFTVKVQPHSFPPSDAVEAPMTLTILAYCFY